MERAWRWTTTSDSLELLVHELVLLLLVLVVLVVLLLDLVDAALVLLLLLLDLLLLVLLRSIEARDIRRIPHINTNRIAYLNSNHLQHPLVLLDPVHLLSKLLLLVLKLALDLKKFENIFF